MATEILGQVLISQVDGGLEALGVKTGAIPRRVEPGAARRRSSGPAVVRSW